MSTLLWIGFVASVYFFTQHFLPWNEQRNDLITVPDPLLNYFPALDTSIPVNFILYVCFGWYGYQLLIEHQVELHEFLLTYTFLLIIRTVMLLAIPLRHPHNMRRLYDPLQLYFLGEHAGFNNDLAVSGHASMLLVMALTCPTQFYFFLWCMILTIFFMMFSKVHYTIDFVNVPFVVFTLNECAKVCLHYMESIH